MYVILTSNNQFYSGEATSLESQTQGIFYSEDRGDAERFDSMNSIRIERALNLIERDPLISSYIIVEFESVPIKH